MLSSGGSKRQSRPPRQHSQSRQQSSQKQYGQLSQKQAQQQPKQGQQQSRRGLKCFLCDRTGYLAKNCLIRQKAAALIR